jgi:hypothetical protein
MILLWQLGWVGKEMLYYWDKVVVCEKEYPFK